MTSVAAMIVLPGCEPGGGGPIAHPLRDSLSIDPDDAIVVGRQEQTSPELDRLAQRLNARTDLTRIGAVEGPPEYEFGDVGDGLFLPDGSLAVLDRMTAMVRVFDREGNHRYSVGGIGEGPGEFNAPVALLAPDDQEVWVLGQARAMHRFRVGEDGGLEFRDRLTLPGFSSDACVAGESIVLHTPAHMPDAQESEVLQKMDRDGNIVKTFAAPYHSDQRLAAKRLNEGRLTCTADGIVLLAFEAQNRLDAYDVTDGTLSWHATFDDVRILPVLEERLEDGRPSIRMDLRSEPYHHLLIRLTGVDGLALVQYGRRLRDDIVEGVDRYHVESYIVDPVTGAGVYAGEQIPEVLALSGDLVAFVSHEPYPQVRIARLGAADR